MQDNPTPPKSGKQTKIVGKYGLETNFTICQGLHPSASQLFISSLATDSWRNKITALNSFTSFCQLNYLKPSFPITLTTLSQYLVHLFYVRNVTKATAENYISSLKAWHSFKGVSTENFSDVRLKSCIRGYGNLRKDKPTTQTPRQVINFSHLQIIGNYLAQQNLPIMDFLNTWTPILLMFWGSFRPGEILPPGLKKHDLSKGLKWLQINRMSKNHIVIELHDPKVSELEGFASVDLISHQDQRYCPLYYLARIKHFAIADSPPGLHEFVFKHSNNKPVTQSDINHFIKRAMAPYFPNEKFTAYSLRAGLLFHLAALPASFSPGEMHSLGRWLSQSSMERYKRVRGSTRLGALEKASNLILER